jgi:hypothetical protein
MVCENAWSGKRQKINRANRMHTPDKIFAISIRVYNLNISINLKILVLRQFKDGINLYSLAKLLLQNFPVMKESSG